MNDGQSPRPEFNPLARRSWTDLGPRVVSALILLTVTVVSLYIGSYLFAAVVGAVFAGCYREWERMVTLRPLSIVGGALIGLLALSALVFPWLGAPWSAAVVAVAAVVAAFGSSGTRLWRIAGVLFYGAVIIITMAMRGPSSWLEWGSFDTGLWAGVFLGVVIFATDTGAYFMGRQLGGEKLAPDISPGKTWSGAIGGFAIGTLAGLVLWLIIVPTSPWWVGLLLAATMSILGQIGDLTESFIKRRFRVKDSGDIIPGHGGLMDRLDSLTFGVIFLFLVGLFHAGFGAIAQGFLFW